MDPREEYQSLPESRFIKTGDERISTFAADVDTASYSTVRRFLNAGTLPPKDAVRIEEMLSYFAIPIPRPTGSSPFPSIPKWQTVRGNLAIICYSLACALRQFPCSRCRPTISSSSSMSWAP